MFSAKHTLECHTFIKVRMSFSVAEKKMIFNIDSVRNIFHAETNFLGEFPFSFLFIYVENNISYY